MIRIYNKIENTEQVQFSMPFSLRVIKILSEKNISYKNLHMADVMSLYYSILIDNAREYLRQVKQEKLQKRGISQVKKATVEDFDKL